MPPKKRAHQDDGTSLDALLDKKLRSVQKLKSAFESIFERFGHDFSEVADEIDMQTGQVIVDNGHLGTMDDVEEQSAWDSDTQQTTDGHLDTSQPQAQSTSYHFTAAERKLYVILSAKGYKLHEMLPYFPTRLPSSLKQYHYNTPRNNTILFRALEQFAKNAISNEFQGSADSYLKSADEEPLSEDVDSTLGDHAWSEQDSARLIRLCHAKLTYGEMSLHFYRRSADDLRRQFRLTRAKNPNLIASVDARWPFKTENSGTSGETLVERLAKDLSEKSDLYYDRPWDANEDEMLRVFRTNNSLFAHAHEILHRSRRSIQTRLRKTDADVSPTRDGDEGSDSRVEEDFLQLASGEDDPEYTLKPKAILRVAGATSKKRPRGRRPKIDGLAELDRLASEDDQAETQQNVTPHLQTRIEISDSPEAEIYISPLNGKVEMLRAPRRRRRSEPTTELEKRRSSRLRRSEPFPVLTGEKHSLSKSEGSSLTPIADGRKRGPSRPPESNMLSLPDDSNDSVANTTRYQRSPSGFQKRWPGRSRKSQTSVYSSEPISSQENLANPGIIEPKVQKRTRGRSSRHAPTSKPENALQVSTNIHQTSECLLSSDQAYGVLSSSMWVDTNELKQNFDFEDGSELPTLPDDSHCEPDPVFQDPHSGLEDAFIQDTDHTASLSAMPSSLEQAGPSKADLEDITAVLPSSYEDHEANSGNRANIDENFCDLNDVSSRTPLPGRKPRKRKRLSSLFCKVSVERRRAKSLAGRSAPLRSEDARRSNGRSSPLRQSLSASQGSRPAKRRHKMTESDADTTPKYLKVQSFKANGRPKRGLFSSSLDSSQTRRLLSGD